MLLGDELLEDWRARTKGGTVRLRAYYDVRPSKDSRLTLDPSVRNCYGDPMPTIEHRFDEPTQARDGAVKEHILGVFTGLARALNGRIVSSGTARTSTIPAVGLSHGPRPGDERVRSDGRAHDHDNLWVVGSPTVPTGGVTNGTLTFVALTLRSADRIASALGGAPAQEA